MGFKDFVVIDFIFLIGSFLLIIYGNVCIKYPGLVPGGCSVNEIESHTLIFFGSILFGSTSLFLVFLLYIFFIGLSHITSG